MRGCGGKKTDERIVALCFLGNGAGAGWLEKTVERVVLLADLKAVYKSENFFYCKTITYRCVATAAQTD